MDRFQTGDSYLHAVDPRVKVVVALLLIIGIVLTGDGQFLAFLMLWLLVLSLGWLGDISPLKLARLGTIALPFTLTAATLMVTAGGDRLVTVAGVDISEPGFIRFASIVLKSWLAVQIAVILSITTHFTDILWALSSLRVPALLVTIIGFMYRYLYTLRDEAERLLRARAARSGQMEGYASGGSLMWRAKIVGQMVGNLFLRSYERSERIYAAMLARGYHGDLRTLNPPPLTVRSIAKGSIPVMILIIIQLAVGGII
jgi:cobalt/nickel transport system permease protein